MKPAMAILLLLAAGTLLLDTAAQELVAGQALTQNVTTDAMGRRGGPMATPQHKTPYPHPTPDPWDKPPPWVNPPHTPAPGVPIFVDEKCIDDPEDYAKAFVTGAVRCVSDNLIVRVERDFIGDLTLNRTTKQKLLENFIDGRVKTVTFWSYGSNPEKYLRIGRKDMKLGNFVDNDPPRGLQNGAFPGIRDGGNYAGLMEAIGYSSTLTDPKRPHFLVVTTRPDQKDVLSYKPTWENAVKYFQYFISKTAAHDPDALKLAGIDPATAHVYKKFTIDPKTTEILKTTTFAELSGCMAECTYQDTTFGTITPDITLRNESWSTPTVSGNRTSVTACNLTLDQQKFQNASSRFELTEPTIIKEDDLQHCDNTTARPYGYYFDQWKTFSNNFTKRGTNRTGNRALALKMAKAYMEETDALRKTIVLRTYLQQSSAGSFNPLISGDGYTYTGNGGFLGATGTELNTGEIPTKEDVPNVFERVRVVFFCLVDKEGNPYPNNICPPEVDGNFNVDDIKAYVSNPNWDIKEVN